MLDVTVTPRQPKSTAKSSAWAGQAAAANNPQHGEMCSLQTHPLKQLPTAQALADAQEKGIILLFPIARLRIHPNTDIKKTINGHLEEGKG